MKHLKITYNGKVYEVDVEEVAGGVAVKSAAPAAAPAPAPAAAPAPAPAPVVNSAPVDGTAVEAPMSGRILENVAPVGTAVKAGDAIFVMEAMKLESEICSDVDGVVREIRVAAKQDVSTGEVLAVIG